MTGKPYAAIILNVMNGEHLTQMPRTTVKPAEMTGTSFVLPQRVPARLHAGNGGPSIQIIRITVLLAEAQIN